MTIFAHRSLRTYQATLPVPSFSRKLCKEACPARLTAPHEATRPESFQTPGKRPARVARGYRILLARPEAPPLQAPRRSGRREEVTPRKCPVPLAVREGIKPPRWRRRRRRRGIWLRREAAATAMAAPLRQWALPRDFPFSPHRRPRSRAPKRPPPRRWLRTNCRKTTRWWRCPS